MILFRKTFLFIALLISISINAQNYVSKYSGDTNTGLINGSIDSAKFNAPFGMCIDGNNNLYIADANNNCIRKINTSTGIVTTFAGTGVAGYKDGSVDSAMFNAPSDLCIDDSGNVYVCDFQNQRIRKISSSGIVSTIAGSGTAGYLDGSAATARFNYPRGICRDAIGNLYIGDSWNHRIRKIDASGVVSTYAGGGTAIGVGSVGSLVDASDTAARFNTPAGLAIDQHGNIFVADAYNHRIRKINSSRVVTTFAGSGLTGMGNGGYMNGYSSAARFNTPTELFVDTNNSVLYISDTFGNRIRKINLTTDTVSTFAGSGGSGFINGIDTLATFNYPRGIVAENGIDRVYVTDYNNNSIRLITSQATSTPEIKFSGDGISVFPNPADEKINIISTNHLINKFEIIDEVGRRVLLSNRNSEKYFRLNISTFNSGIYIIKMLDESGNIIVKRFIKE